MTSQDLFVATSIIVGGTLLFATVLAGKSNSDFCIICMYILFEKLLMYNMIPESRADVKLLHCLEQFAWTRVLDS